MIMNIDKPLLDGKLHIKSIDNWDITWETNENYRHWCYQCHPNNDKSALLVLFNPGSLNSSGEKLNQDQTLRILREVFLSSGINPFIINLFDYADSQQNKLYKNWESRDYKLLIYEKLVTFDFISIIYAYGKIEYDDPHYADIISRINQIQKYFLHLNKLKIDDKTAHPRRWHFEKSKKRIHNILLSLQK
jgi:Protein of unknown function (DUF1643)